MRLQWRDIRDGLYENYKEKYRNEYSFNVTLHRTLARLLREGDIEKEEAGHQEVFYFIPKRRRGRIEEELDREFAHKRFDDFWDMLTPEQRKKTVHNLAEAGQSMVIVVQELLANLTGGLKEWTEETISRLEIPTEYIKEKHSPDQRKQILRELYNLRGEFEKMSIIKARTKRKDLKEEHKVLLDLTKEFIKNVVEPHYSGEWGAAIMDLMRKAVKEHKKKGKRSK